MKKLVLVIVSIILCLSSHAQSWSWASSVGGRSNTDGSTDIARDASGNYYIAADFEGTRSFGAASLTSAGLSDLFLTKLNSSGAIQWTVQVSGQGANTMEVGGVAVDAAGNVYLAGHFSFTAIFQGGTQLFNPGGNSGGFIAKFNPVSGAVIWAKAIAGTGTERISNLKISGTTLYIAGSYTQSFSVNTVTVPAAAGGEDAYIMKLDSAGTALWGIRGGGSGDDRGLALSVSGSTICWAGYFTGAGSILGTNVTSAGGFPDIFVAKLTDAGTALWVKDYGGNFGEQVNSVSLDPWGNVFCAGNFYGTVSFGTGLTIVEAYMMQPAGNGDAFVIKLNSADGVCQWVRHIRCVSGDNNEVSNSISVDPGGSGYVTGHFNANTVFANASNQTGTAVQATNGADAYLAKYGQTGNLLWVVKIGGTANDRGKAVLWDAGGFVNVAGNFGGTITFGASSVTASVGASSLFLARYNGLTTGIGETNQNLEVEVFPNPSTDFLNVKSAGNEAIDRIDIYSTNGQQVFSSAFPALSHEVSLNVSELQSGVYLVHVFSGNSKSIRKITIR
jgi:hypothetical protein